MKLKTFEVLFVLYIPDTEKLDREVNNWLAKHPGTEICHRDFHTRSGLNTLDQPYTYFTLLLWYKGENANPSSEVLDYSVRALDLSTLPLNALLSNGIETVRQVYELEKGLLKIRYFGRKGFNEVREKLRGLGLRLGKGWKFGGHGDRNWTPDL